MASPLLRPDEELGAKAEQMLETERAARALGLDFATYEIVPPSWLDAVYDGEQPPVTETGRAVPDANAVSDGVADWFTPRIDAVPLADEGSRVLRTSSLWRGGERPAGVDWTLLSDRPIVRSQIAHVLAALYRPYAALCRRVLGGGDQRVVRASIIAMEMLDVWINGTIVVDAGADAVHVFYGERSGVSFHFVAGRGVPDGSPVDGRVLSELVDVGRSLGPVGEETAVEVEFNIDRSATLYVMQRATRPPEAPVVKVAATGLQQPRSPQGRERILSEISQGTPLVLPLLSDRYIDCVALAWLVDAHQVDPSAIDLVFCASPRSHTGLEMHLPTVLPRLLDGARIRRGTTAGRAAATIE